MPSPLHLLQLLHYYPLLSSEGEGTIIMPTLQMRNEERRLRNLPRITLTSQDWTTGLWTPKLALNQYACIASSEIKDLWLIGAVFKLRVSFLVVYSNFQNL